MYGSVNPWRGEPPTGEPDAGKPHVRFGGGRDRVTGLSYPYNAGRLKPTLYLGLYAWVVEHELARHCQATILGNRVLTVPPLPGSMTVQATRKPSAGWVIRPIC